MNKLIKVGDTAIVYLENGESYSKKVTREEFMFISDNIDNNDVLIGIFIPNYAEYLEEKNEVEKFIQEINEIPFLFYNKEERGVYWEGVSPLSMPEDFVKSVIEAYKKNDEKALHAYKNFWILLSLNPSDECRKNLWWFLQRNGLVISSSGFFIGYRNANKTDKYDDEGYPIYTDAHSGTTKISIGHTVSMPRNKVDCNIEVTCSHGLHIGSSDWLKENYFGDTGLICLVNPVNVCALPRLDYYGKMRVCEYMPIDYANYDKDGNVIPYNVEQGFECKYAAQAIYEGVISIENDKYSIKVPKDCLNNNPNITSNLLQLAKECVLKKNYEDYRKQKD